MTLLGWLTNSRSYAARLRTIDATYDRRIAAASGLRLADKIEAIRAARAERDSGYAAIERELDGKLK